MAWKEVELSSIIAEVFDSDAIVPQQRLIYRLDMQGSRNYFTYENGQLILSPSVTSIISKCHPMSPYLKTWWANKGEAEAKRILKESSTYGTFVHIMYGKLIRGEDVSLSTTSLLTEINTVLERENVKMWEIDDSEWVRKVRQDLIGFIQWNQDYKVNPIALEYSFVNADFSGTIDLVARINGEDELVIIDFKTNRDTFYPDNTIQLAGYRDGWNREQDRKVTKVYDYGCKEFRLPIGKTVTPYRFTEQTDEVELLSAWHIYLGLYNLLYKKDAPKFHDISESKVNLKSDIKSVIIEIDPIQIITEARANEEQNKEGVQGVKTTDTGEDKGWGTFSVGNSEESRLF